MLKTVFARSLKGIQRLRNVPGNGYNFWGSVINTNPIVEVWPYNLLKVPLSFVGLIYICYIFIYVLVH